MGEAFQFRQRIPRGISSNCSIQPTNAICKSENVGIERSQICDTWVPCAANALHFLEKPRATDLKRSIGLGKLGIMLVRNVEWVTKEPDVCILERLKGLQQISLSVQPRWHVKCPTGVKSLFLNPSPAVTFIPSAEAPSMSTTMMSLTPVLVNQPYMAILSSSA